MKLSTLRTKQKDEIQRICGRLGNQRQTAMGLLQYDKIVFQMAAKVTVVAGDLKTILSLILIKLT
jgi:hypothetical protein